MSGEHGRRGCVPRTDAVVLAAVRAGVSPKRNRCFATPPRESALIMWAPPTYKCALNKLRDGESVAKKSVICITPDTFIVHGFAKETASLLLEFEEIHEADFVLVSSRSA